MCRYFVYYHLFILCLQVFSISLASVYFNFSLFVPSRVTKVLCRQFLKKLPFCFIKCLFFNYQFHSFLPLWVLFIYLFICCFLVILFALLYFLQFLELNVFNFCFYFFDEFMRIRKVLLQQFPQILNQSVLTAAEFQSIY